MKRTRKHSWLIGLALVLILAVCLSLPVAASAPTSDGDGGVVPVQEGGPVPSDGFPNLPEGTVLVGNNATTLALDTEELYGIEVFAVCGEGAEFASYEMHLYLPSFMTFDSVVCADENALFTWNYESEVLSVACSTTTDREADSLFTVYFYLNEDATLESAGAFEDAGKTFTNTSFVNLPVITLFGEISVYEEMPLKGDVNLDGEITIDDAIALQQIIVRINDSPRYYTDEFYAADVNNDNMLDIIDVQYIQMYLIGEIDSLEDVYAEDPLILIRVNFFDQYGNVLANRILTAPPAGEATTTYPALVEFINQWAGDLFPGMTVESLYAESGADVYAATSIVTGDDVLNVFLRSDKGDEPFTYDENEVQTRVSTDGQFTVYQYADYEDVVAAVAGNTIIVEKYVERDGEYHTISCNGYVLTADNIGDVSDVDFSTLNEYVDISVFVNGEEYVIDLRVVPNTDGLEIITEGVRREVSAVGDGGTEVDYYYFVAYGNGLIESCDFDDRNDETAWRDYMEYEAVWENDELLFAINQNGMTLYYMQSNETYEGYTVVTEYRPGREEQTTSYTLSLGDNMTVRFEVFGNDYAMMFQTNPRTGAMELGGTVKVEIDAENNTFVFANTTFTIGENNVLTLGVPDDEPIEIVDYFGDEITFVLFEGGTGYYAMNGEPVMMLDGWSYVYSADQEAPVALKISMSGDELVFVIWEIDGKWHEGDEPDFSNADIRLFYLDGEEVTLYCWAGTDNGYLQFGDAALIQANYNANADTIRYYAPSGDYVFLINGTDLIPAEQYMLRVGGVNYNVLLGGGIASGFLGSLTDYQTVRMTYVIGEDNVWTFLDETGLNVIVECVASADSPKTLQAVYGNGSSDEFFTVHVTYLCEGEVLDEFDAQMPYGYEIGELATSVNRTFQDQDEKTGEVRGTYLCTGVFYDAEGESPVHEEDILAKPVSIYYVCVPYIGD